MAKPIANYNVGYGRPPRQHQFKAGQSGNPSGRPKGVRSFKSDLRDELAEVVSVKHGNKTLELTRQRAREIAMISRGPPSMATRNSFLLRKSLRYRG
jgi:hypothetical protein